jgi:UrcA family protein
MTSKAFPYLSRCLASVAAGALSLAMIVPVAHAQAYDNGAYYQSGDEVIVQAPHHAREYSPIGAPIEDVSISRVVRYDDLDLRTHWGADELRSRVNQAASSACDEMDTMHPVATSDSPPCYSTAVRDGMEQARDAIDQARDW